MQCISVLGEVYLNVHTTSRDTKSGHWNFVITTVGMRPLDIQIRDIHGSCYSNRVITFVDLASKRIYIFINQAYLYTIAIHLFAASREMVTLQNFIHSNSKVRTTLYSIYIINRTTFLALCLEQTRRPLVSKSLV